MSGGFFARVFVPNTTLLKKYFYLRIISVPLKYDVSHYSGYPIITTVIVAKLKYKAQQVVIHKTFVPFIMIQC